MLSGLRIKGAGETKRYHGGYPGLHPDGYQSVEDDQPGRKSYMKKEHHLEQDPERAKIWRFAWDLLLEDRLTLAEIAEEIHIRGYRHRSGRPFVEVKENGKRKANYNTLADIFPKGKQWQKFLGEPRRESKIRRRCRMLEWSFR